MTTDPYFEDAMGEDIPISGALHTSISGALHTSISRALHTSISGDFEDNHDDKQNEEPPTRFTRS